MKKLLLTILLLTIVVKTPTPTTLKIDQFSLFSEFTLKRLIYILKIEHPDIVFIQAQIESAHFKSNIFRENNNLFGMKVAKKRPTSAIGINRGHASYTKWQHSVIDYKLMQKRYAHNKSRNQYFVYLKHYAADPKYILKIKERL